MINARLTASQPQPAASLLIPVVGARRYEFGWQVSAGDADLHPCVLAKLLAEPQGL